MITHPILSRAANRGVRLGLQRVEALLDLLGAPHRAVPVVHVAGTNGKGSVVRLLASALGAAGYRVGELTSPHLQRVNERVRADGAEIADDALAALLLEIEQTWTREAGDLARDCAPTYFELLTIAGFLHFARVGLDVALVEVGLGGRLDATNVVDPLATAITTIDLDHCEVLGGDRASIAAEKAGIVKSGRPVVVGRVPDEAFRVIRAIAAERAAPVERLDEDFRVRPRGDGVFDWSRPGGRSLRGLRVGLAGSHQVDNAAVAVAILDRLADRFPVPEDALRAGLARATHPGRLEWLAPDLLVDAAHNPAGAARLAAALRELPRDRSRTLLLGAGADKDARGIAVTLAPQVDRILTTSSAHPRALSAGDLASRLVGVDVPVLPAGPVEAALPLARDGSLVIGAGSIFLVGAIRDLVGAP